MYDKDHLLKSMGVSSLSEVDPYSPDVYIKPRPGKYGWKPLELTKEYKRVMDSKLVQTMKDEEREENRKYHVQFYEESVMLNRLGDYETGREARMESDKRKDADPWYDLNERMWDAVKTEDQEEISYLKDLIEKVGGPPPSLKDKVNEEGYVPLSSIYSWTLSNQRLEELIRDYNDPGYEEWERQISVVRSMKDVDRKAFMESDKKKELDEEAVRKIARERAKSRVRWVGGLDSYGMEEWEVGERMAEKDEERKVSWCCCLLSFCSRCLVLDEICA
jgi:hypothetical protein